MSDPTSTPDIFHEFLSVLGNQAFMAVNTVVMATLEDIRTNPQVWLNPLTAPIKGAAAVAALNGALPNVEGSSVASAAQLVEALWTNLGHQLATGAPSVAQIAATAEGAPATAA